MSNVRADVAAAAHRSGLPDVLQFMQLLWAVVHGLERISKRMAGDIGVTGPQRLVLRVVGLFPGMSAGDLATVLHVHPSTLTECCSDSSPSDSWRAPRIRAIGGVPCCASRRGVRE
jgi:hypothetical protein